MSDFTIHENSGLENLDGSQASSHYTYVYRGVAACNKLLSELPGIEIRDKNLKERYYGEIYFLRGLYNFYGTILFKEPPLLLEDVLNDPPETQYGNTPREQIYPAIAKDLRNAIKRLPEQYPEEDIGRATKGAALAQLGKFYLYIQEWDSAYHYLGKVKELGIYELIQPQAETPEDYIEAYRSNFCPVDRNVKNRVYKAENNKESVFEVQYTNNPQHWNKYLPGYGNDGSMMHAYFGINGWRNIVPTKAFVNEHFKDLPSHPVGLTKDPRFYASIYVNGDTIETNPRNTDETWIFDHQSDANLGIWQGYGQKKYLFPVHQLPTTPYDDPNNWRLIRYADVLLMVAEAAFQLGKNDEAANNLNMVRARAGLPGIDAASISKEDIIRERNVELCFECSRALDIIRWSGAYDINPGNDVSGEDEWSDPESLINNFVADKHIFLPFPQAEININGGKLKQNNKW
jgi:hypothetical protein